MRNKRCKYFIRWVQPCSKLSLTRVPSETTLQYCTNKNSNSEGTRHNQTAWDCESGPLSLARPLTLLVGIYWNLKVIKANTTCIIIDIIICITHRHTFSIHIKLIKFNFLFGIWQPECCLLFRAKKVVWRSPCTLVVNPFQLLLF